MKAYYITFSTPWEVFVEYDGYLLSLCEALSGLHFIESFRVKEKTGEMEEVRFSFRFEDKDNRDACYTVLKELEFPIDNLKKVK